MKKRLLLIAASVALLMSACNKNAENENSEDKSAHSENESSSAVSFEGSWDEDKTTYTTYYGYKLSSEEYDKLMKKTQDKDFIDLATEDMIDFYLLRTDFYRTDMLKVYMQDVAFSDDISYSEFYSETADGSFHDYKIIAKATLDINAYEEIKTSLENNNERGLTTVEDFNSLLNDEDRKKVGATGDFTVYGGKNMMGLKTDENTTKTAEGISAILLNEAEKKMIIYYYNPLFEQEINMQNK